MKQDTQKTQKPSAVGAPNPWTEMSSFERVFLCFVLGALVLFIILVSVFWSWKAVGLILLALVLSRIPFLILLQLVLLLAGIFVVGALVFA